MNEKKADRIKREEREKIEDLRPMSRLKFQILYGKCASSGWVYGEFNETLYQQYLQRYGFFLCHLLFLKNKKIDEDGLLTKLSEKSDIYFLIDTSSLIHTISLPGTTQFYDPSINIDSKNIKWFFAESPNTLDTYVYNPDKNTETAYYTGPLTILKTAALTEVLSASKLTTEQLTSAAKAARNAASNVINKVKETRAAAAALTAEAAAAKTALTESAKTALTVALNKVEQLTTELTNGLIEAAKSAAAAAATKSAAATLEDATALATEAEAAVAAVAASAAVAVNAEAEVAEALKASTALATELKTETAETVLAALKEAVLLVQTTTQKKNWINQNIILLDFFPFPIIMSTDIRKDVVDKGYTFRKHLSEYFKPLVENVKKLFDETAPANVYLIAPTYTSVHAILELTDFEWAELVTLKDSSTYKQFIEELPFGFDTKKTPEKIYDGHLKIRKNEFGEFKKKFNLETSSYFLNNNILSAKEKYSEFCAYLKKRIYLNDGNFPGIPGVNE